MSTDVKTFKTSRDVPDVTKQEDETRREEMISLKKGGPPKPPTSPSGSFTTQGNRLPPVAVLPPRRRATPSPQGHSTDRFLQFCCLFCFYSMSVRMYGCFLYVVFKWVNSHPETSPVNVCNIGRFSDRAIISASGSNDAEGHVKDVEDVKTRQDEKR